MGKKNEARVLEDVSEVVEVVQVVVPVDEKGRKKVVDVPMEVLETKGLKTTSAAIRYLAGENYSPSAIAKYLNKRYQHVRNVLNQTLKKPAE